MEPTRPHDVSSTVEPYGFAADRPAAESGARALLTRNHEVIRQWAVRHGAEPATGEATVSGPATRHVNDGGSGLRFNFPGLARFRPISWSEWLDEFERHDLVFMYEEEIADRAYSLWERRGRTPGRALDDWLEAERQLSQASPSPMGRYRIVGSRSRS